MVSNHNKNSRLDFGWNSGACVRSAVLTLFCHAFMQYLHEICRGYRYTFQRCAANFSIACPVYVPIGHSSDDSFQILDICPLKRLLPDVYTENNFTFKTLDDISEKSHNPIGLMVFFWRCFESVYA